MLSATKIFIPFSIMSVPYKIVPNDKVESNDPRNIQSLSMFEPIVFKALKTNRYNVSDGSSHVFDFYLKPNIY